MRADATPGVIAGRRGPISADRLEWRERASRKLIELDGFVLRDNGSMVATVISALSHNGCRLAGAFAIGECVEVRFEPVGVLRAQVRWAIPDAAGVRFLYPGE
jgi:hypothetical protein